MRAEREEDECSFFLRPDEEEHKVQRKTRQQKSVFFPEKKGTGEGGFLAVVRVWGGFTPKVCLW